MVVPQKFSQVSLLGYLRWGVRSVHPRASRSGGIVAFTATAVGETSTSLARLKRLKLLADLHLFRMEFALPYKRTTPPN